MKKSKKSSDNSPNGMNSDSPTTPDYDLQENALSDEFSSGLDLKSAPAKSKRMTGWTDEPVRSANSGKYVTIFQCVHSKNAINRTA